MSSTVNLNSFTSPLALDSTMFPSVEFFIFEALLVTSSLLVLDNTNLLPVGEGIVGILLLKRKATFEAHFHVLPIASYSWL